jgi:hypothetical protein
VPTRLGGAMIRQIVIQAEPHDDLKSMFRLSIDAILVAEGVTVGQACYLVSEILGRIGAHDAETTTVDAGSRAGSEEAEDES